MWDVSQRRFQMHVAGGPNGATVKSFLEEGTGTPAGEPMNDLPRPMFMIL